MVGNDDRPVLVEAVIDPAPRPDDEGGLHAPPELHGWRKAWWWFDFIILVKLARLRFIGILVVIGLVITQWDTLAAYYDKWTRPAIAVEAGASDTEYFCPMHPTVIRDNPKDKCPICFMPLSKRKKGSEHVDPLPDGVVNRVQLTPYRVVLAGVQTWPVEYTPLTKEITAVGTIEFDERGQRTVAARVNGRIDKVLANETGKMVKAGDPLVSLYSPELLVTMQNMRDAKRRDDQALVGSFQKRLQLLGVDEAQIAEALANDKTDIHVLVRSPINGHIIRKYVREGQYVQEGMPLYDVTDLSTVWIQAQIYEDDLALVPAGYEHGAKPADLPGLTVTATTRAAPNQVFHGKLAFIYPHVDLETRTVTVRIELENPGHKLRPGSTAKVMLKLQPQELPSLLSKNADARSRQMWAEGRVLAVPEGSVIDTGIQRIVYRQDTPGVFEGVEVALGPRMSNPEGATFYPLLGGLEQGSRVVTSGSFLVDAETRLNPAAGSIYFGGSSGSKSGGATTIRPTTPEDSDAKIEAALANLSPEDRARAREQKYCPELDSLLGSMGTPIKLLVEGKPVFLCCSGCKKKALADPQATLAKLAKLKQEKLEPLATQDTAPKPPAEEKGEEADIRAALAKLPPADRALAEAQRFCAVLTDNRLGSMDAPIKLVLDGQPVFLCCEGCEKKAQAKPEETAAVAKRLRETHGSSPKR